MVLHITLFHRPEVWSVLRLIVPTVLAPDFFNCRMLAAAQMKPFEPDML